ncbi:MAG: hypothetical protein WD381_06030 [Balneolaceae bacterium]
MNNNLTEQQTPLFYFISNSVKKGSRSTIVAFLFLSLALAGISCEDSGIVGGGSDTDSDKVTTTEIEITDLEILSGNGFSGQLGSSSLGQVEDPFFGDIYSISLLKPSITADADLETFDADTEMKLRVVFNPLKYGNESSVSEYNIYEVDERWRGREISYNTLISFDETNLIGSFDLTDEEEVDVDLSDEWVNRYREFYNSEAADRDSTYNFEFPGIAVVPADQNDRVDFLRYQPASDDTAGVDITRFIIENEEDSISVVMPLADWASSMTRSNQPESSDEYFVLHNTLEQILKLTIDLDEEQFTGQDIINAQMIFYVDPEVESTTPAGFSRPEPALLRAHIFNDDPLNVTDEIFTTESSSSATIDTDENAYQINVTNYLLNNLYGEGDPLSVYVSLQNTNGLLYSSRFVNENGAANRTPRLIITTINTEN